MSKLCEQCFYWDMFPEKPTHGKCRFLPPRVLNTEFGTYTEWPIVESSDWCGEFYAMPEDVASGA